MKQLIRRLCVALLTFVLGVAAVMLYLAHNAPATSPPVVEGPEAPAAPVAATCYPGRSVKTQVMGRLLYFPPGVFSTNEWHDRFREAWYSKHLEAMNEASFYFPDNSENESYRFLLLRSFHHPVAVRIWSSDGERFIAAKELNGAGGYKPGKLIVSRTRKVAKGEWDELTRLLEHACYWELPTEDEDLGGNDGAQWILEGVRSSRYHVVDRWSPRSGRYREACLYMLKLSGLGVDASGKELY